MAVRFERATITVHDLEGMMRLHRHDNRPIDSPRRAIA